MAEQQKRSRLSADAMRGTWLITERPENPKKANDPYALPLVRHKYYPLSGGPPEIVDWEIERPPLQNRADVQVYVQSCLSSNPQLRGVKRVVKTVTFDTKEEILHRQEVHAMVKFGGRADNVGAYLGFSPIATLEVQKLTCGFRTENAASLST